MLSDSDPVMPSPSRRQRARHIVPIRPLTFTHDRRPLESLSPQELVRLAKDRRGHTISVAQAEGMIKESRGRTVDDIDDVLSGMGGF